MKHIFTYIALCVVLAIISVVAAFICSTLGVAIVGTIFYCLSGLLGGTGLILIVIGYISVEKRAKRIAKEKALKEEQELQKSENANNE